MPANYFDQFDSESTPSIPQQSASNYFDQFDAQQPSAPPRGTPGWSLGPITDAATLLNRGVDWAIQKATGIQPTTPQRELGTPVNLPFLGKPSAVGMGEGLYEAGKSAATLPGDVYAGRVDPLSEEGIKRAADLAMLTQLPSVPSVSRRAAVGAPLATSEIRDAASAGYNSLRDNLRRDVLPEGTLNDVTDTVRNHVIDNGPSPKRAPAVYKEIEDMRTPAAQGDLGDVVDTRKNLMEMVRGTRRDATGNLIPKLSGDERTAALRAVEAIDDHLDPVLVSQMKELDKNWAIGSRAGTYEARIADAIEKAQGRGSGGNVGNLIRQAVEPLTLSKTKYVSPEVLAAAQDVTRPGMTAQALRSLSIFDPTRHKLMGGAMGLMALPGHIASGGTTLIPHVALGLGGYGARTMYDRMLRNRAAAVLEAIRAEAPASLAAGYIPGGLAPLAAPTVTPLAAFPAFGAEQRFQYR